MSLPQLTLFTAPSALFHVGHHQLGRLLDRIVLLFPGRYSLPSAEAMNDGFFQSLAYVVAEPGALPPPVLNAFHEVETLASPENVPNLHIPPNVDPRDRESLPLYHAIQAWITAHPLEPAAPAPTPPQPRPDTPVPATPAPQQLSAGPRRSPDSTASPSSSADPLCADPELPHVSPPPPLNLRLSVLFFEVDPHLRHEFFTHFEPDLRQAFPELPKLSVGNDDFDMAVYRLLKDPAFLPESMRQALLAIQELAAPANRQLLRALVNHFGIYAERSATAQHFAVACWLRRPFAPGTIDKLRASVPMILPSPAQSSNSDNGQFQVPPTDPPLFPESAQPQSPGLVTPLADRAAIARFPRNKISHLPADVREELNQMLRRRVAYSQIVSRLGSRAPGLNKSNLSRWKKTGYQLWLAEQQRREDAQAQIQLLLDVVRENDNARLHEATQQIAALRITQVLAAFDPATLTKAFLTEPQAFIRLVQTLPGLSRGGIACERVLLESAERKASLDPEKKPPRGLSEETLQYITERLNLA